MRRRGAGTAWFGDPAAGDAAAPAAAAAPGASADQAVPVSTLTAMARDVLEGAFPPLWISGEVSNFQRHRNGHWYFTIKDAAAAIDCVVWGSDQARFPAAPDDGMQVAAFGRLTMWARRARVQFTLHRMEAEGEGLWRKAFEAVRAALDADGLLDPARKRPLPRFPRVVGVVTSADGAALHDIISVIGRRNPGIDVVLIPAAVQGEAAPASLVRALEAAAAWGGADVLIVTRGGGSREDLWAFNDESVARAIAASPIPTVSAVGHEVDVTIADYVADARAPTPSAAAELVAPVLDDVRRDLAALSAGMSSALARRVREGRREVARTVRVIRALATRATERGRERLRADGARIAVLSPLATLARGYALPRAADGRTLSRVAQYAAGMDFGLVLTDGVVEATANAVRPGAVS